MELHDSVGERHECRIMGRHHSGHPALVHDLDHKAHDRRRRAAVELPGWFVCEENARFSREITRDADPLLLSTRELVRMLKRVVGQADAVEKARDAFHPLITLHACESQGQLDILRGGQRRQQAEALEDESEHPTADADQLGFRGRGRDDSVDRDRPEVWLVESAKQVLSRALTELRELARGITPTVLSHGGVRGAAEDLAHRCPVPTTVRTSGDIALSQLTQATIYFLVAEGLTNVAKHSAANAATVSIDLAEVATVTISDNGVGGASVNFGSGLRGLVDRVEATGGSLRVDSPPGRGTTIVAKLPLTDVG